MPSDLTTSVRPASSRVSCATVVALSEHGSWSGTVWSSVSSSQRILSLWLERLSTDRIARQWREAPSPLVVFGKRGNLVRLPAIDAGAERLGLTVGLALAQARAMHPTLTAVPEDFAADARLLDAIAEACQRYTPLIALDPPDGILLDIAGCAHLFGGEQSLVDDLTARVANFGFTLRAALASTIGAAGAASRHSATTIVAPGAEREFLAPLPIAAHRAHPVSRRRRGAPHRGCDLASLARPAERARAVFRAAQKPRRCARSRLRLRSRPARRAARRAVAAGADRSRRKRARGRRRS